MTKRGSVHKVPTDLQKTLDSTSAVRTAWEDITLLARNEWICWVGLGPPENRRQEVAGLREHAWSLLKESADLVAGPVVPIVEIGVAEFSKKQN